MLQSEGTMIDPPMVPGIVHLRSERRAVATVDKLAEIVRAKGLTVFSRIDFASDAATAGLTVPPIIQLAFGNPRAGTPLIAANPAVALALPDQILCQADCAGLCPICGKNLNTEPHEHEAEAPDSRWSALEQLRDQL